MKPKNMRIGQDDGLFTEDCSTSSASPEEDDVSEDKLFHNDSTSAGLILEIPTYQRIYVYHVYIHISFRN